MYTRTPSGRRGKCHLCIGVGILAKDSFLFGILCSGKASWAQEGGVNLTLSIVCDKKINLLPFTGGEFLLTVHKLIRGLTLIHHLVDGNFEKEDDVVYRHGNSNNVYI